MGISYVPSLTIPDLPSPEYKESKQKMAQIPNNGSEDSLISIRIRLDRKLLHSNQAFCKITENANFQMLTSPSSVLLPESCRLSNPPAPGRIQWSHPTVVHYL